MDSMDNMLGKKKRKDPKLPSDPRVEKEDPRVSNPVNFVFDDILFQTRTRSAESYLSDFILRCVSCRLRCYLECEPKSVIQILLNFNPACVVSPSLSMRASATDPDHSDLALGDVFRFMSTSFRAPIHRRRRRELILSLGEGVSSF